MSRGGVSMRLMVGLAALMLGWLVPAFADEPAPLVPLKEVWQRYDALSDAGNYKEALAVMSSYAADARRTGAERARLYGMTAVVCARLKDPACYRANIAEALKVDQNVGHFMAALLFSDAPDKDSAVESFIWLVQNNSNMLPGISIRNIWSYVNHYRETHEDDKSYALLTILHDSGYRGDSQGSTPEYLWFELARLMAARGETEAAKAIVQETQFGTDLYIRAWQDKDYQALWPMLESDPRYAPDKLLDMDLKLAVLQEARAQKRGWGPWLQARVTHVQALRGAGRTEDAIEVAEQTQEVVPEKDRTDDYYYWLENELAYAYEDVSRADDGLALMAKVTEADLKASPSLINQVINYAEMLWRHDRFDDAIKVADRILGPERKNVSDFGAYWAQTSKLCSLHALAREDEAMALYRPMYGKAKTNYGAATMAALCLGRTDDAAALYKARLKSEQYRSSALLALSHFHASGLKDGTAALRAEVDKIAARPDVLAAVKAVGRLGTWDFSLSYWGEF